MIADAFVAAAGGNGDEPATPDVYEQRAFGFWLYLMSDAIIFSLLFVILLVRPTGFFGTLRRERRVARE